MNTSMIVHRTPAQSSISPSQSSAFNFASLKLNRCSMLRKSILAGLAGIAIAIAALPAQAAQWVQLGEQTRRGRILEVAEQMDADAVVLAGDLDPANQGDPVAPGGGRGLVPARRRVVICQRDHVKTCLGRGPHDLRR